MPKYIQSTTYQSDRSTIKIKYLEKRTHELEEEVRRLRALVKPDQRYPKDQKDQGGNKKQPRPSTEVPSYQRDTVSSRNRIINGEPEPPQPKLINTDKAVGRYQDGRFITVSVKRDRFERRFINVEKSTQSSENKKREAFRRPIDYRPIIRFRTNDPYDYSDPEYWHSQDVWDDSECTARDNTVSTTEEHHTTPDPEEDTNPEKKNPRIVDDVPKLEDDIACTHIPTATAYQILTEALSLAKTIFHDAAKKHWPSLWEKRFPDGPHEVLFGFAELGRCFSGFYQSLRVGNYSDKEVMAAIYDIISLRNIVSHFGRSGNWCNLEDYEQFLVSVFCLADRVDDEDGAEKAQELRRRLRREGRNTRAELELLEPLSLLPFAEPWASHQVATLHHFPLWQFDTPAERHPDMMLRMVEHRQMIEKRVVLSTE
ncbi:hypothetical protein F4775DRAFT_590125 [Biscogniauxia sp. FL1348]|nr:hypothetical protein F4775DRAFT_590125 [Biscogniauxia sp. FL1348]